MVHLQIGKIVSLVLLLFGLSLNAATTNSIIQWGINWQFSNACTYGMFANGDYWVTTPVVITNITPAWDGIYNGTEINPTVQFYQGFSSNSKTAVTFTNTLNILPPFTLLTNCSVVSTIGGTNISSYSSIHTAAVLTVLIASPPDDGSNAFRPPYVGTNKPIYLVSDLKSNLLPSLPPVVSSPTLVTIAINFSKCLRMDHHISVPAWFRPSGSMNFYQPNNTIDVNEAMLRLMLDDSYATKLPALIQFTQHTIDQGYAALLGYNKMDDGENPNHRILAAWAATLLDITSLKTLLATNLLFYEDYDISPGTNGAIWGHAYPELLYWNNLMFGTGDKSIADPYGYIDGGDLTPGAAAYQNIVSQSFKGQALIYKLFPQLQQCITVSGCNNLFGYASRWVSHGTLSMPDPAAPYDGVPANYGVTFGPNGGGSYIAGSGRFPAANGQYRDQGQYKSLFVSNMWYAYWTSPEMTIRGKATFNGKATIR